MSDTSGYLVEYASKDGSKQMGIVRHSEQKKEFKEIKKCLVRLINDDHTEKKDESGKKVIALKNAELLKLIGYV